MRSERVGRGDRATVCADVVAAVLDPAPVADLAVRRHLASCAACRGELEAQRALRRLLSSGAAPAPAPPEGLLEDVLAVVAREAGSLRRRMARVAPYLGGVLAATAAGAALAAASRRGPVHPAA